MINALKDEIFLARQLAPLRVKNNTRPEASFISLAGILRFCFYNFSTFRQRSDGVVFSFQLREKRNIFLS